MLDMPSIEQMMSNIIAFTQEHEETTETGKVLRLMILVTSVTDKYSHSTETLTMISAICKGDHYDGDKIQAIRILLHERALEHLGLTEEQS